MFNRNILGISGLLGLLSLSLGLTSCFNDNDDDSFDKKEWTQRNEAYVAEAQSSGEYETLTPPWAPQAISLVKWHNNRALTAKNLSPLDNSLVDVKYDCSDIDGTLIDSSYKSTQYGDSIYRSRPSSNVTGFWYLVTQMHVGDTVTAVLPAISAYGGVAYGSIKPNTTLIYHIKLVSIPAYEVPLGGR